MKHLYKFNENIKSEEISEMIKDIFQEVIDDGIDISYRRNQWGVLLDQDSIEFSWYGHWKNLNLSKESYSLISKMANLSRICNYASLPFDENDNIQSLMKTNEYILLKRYFDRMGQELDIKIKSIDYLQDPPAQYWNLCSGYVVIFISKIEAI
jgi:hypothetical protein